MTITEQDDHTAEQTPNPTQQNVMLTWLTPTDRDDRDVGETHLQSLGLGWQPGAQEQKPPAAACDSFQA